MKPENRPKSKEEFRKDVIETADDLRAALPGVPVFDLTDEVIPRSEEMQRLIDAIRKTGDGTAQ